MSFSETIRTFAEKLNDANPNLLATLLQQVKLGKMLDPVKVTFAGLTAAAAIDITTSASRTGATINLGLEGIAAGEGLPPIQMVKTLRVTASATAASLGTYIVSDSGGTAIIPPGGAGAAVGIALLSDDGKTITFPNTITAFVLEYMPRSEVDLTDTYNET